MEREIYNLLYYIKQNGKVPKCEEINVTQDRLKLLVKKCNSEFLLDKNFIYVNVLGKIQSDDNADMGITKFGLEYLERYNPVGKVMK